MKNKALKILQALAVAVFGFILLNLTFLLDYFFHILVLGFIKLFTSIDLMRTYGWFPPIMHSLFVIIIGITSWFVFKSKLKTLYKAIYMTVPLAVVFVSLGMFFYRWPIIAYSLGAIFSLSLLHYFYRTKKPWLYFYTLILVSLTLAIFSLLGGEI